MLSIQFLNKHTNTLLQQLIHTHLLGEQQLPKVMGQTLQNAQTAAKNMTTQQVQVCQHHTEAKVILAQDIIST